MFKSIDHIGIAVENLDAAVDGYAAMGLKVAGPPEDVVSQGVRVVMIPCGDTRLELLQPTNPESPVAKFIEKRGTGVHHIAYCVDDIHSAMEAAKMAGKRPLSPEPRHGHGGTLVCFIHPKDMDGVLTEFVEHPAGSAH